MKILQTQSRFPVLTLFGAQNRDSKFVQKSRCSSACKIHGKKGLKIRRFQYFRIEYLENGKRRDNKTWLIDAGPQQLRF